MLTHLSLLLALAGPARADELVVLIPGLGDNRHSRPCLDELAETVADRGYKVVIAEYQQRSSVEASAEALTDFIAAQHPESYPKVHVMAWILGTWALNDAMKAQPIPNLASVVYDRSPTQERAPAAVVRVGRPFVWLMFGRLVRDLSRTPYSSWIPSAGVQVGLYVENRATDLMIRLRRIGERMGPLHYEPESFQQEHADITYSTLDHDRLYLRHDVLWPELEHFFRQGRFSEEARRTPMEGDPWQAPALEEECRMPAR